MFYFDSNTASGLSFFHNLEEWVSDTPVFP
jgi:hypothetical protein